MARDAQHQAEVAERQATTEAAVARAVNSFLQEDLLGQVNRAPEDGMDFQGNPNLTVRETLHRASTKVAERFRHQPVVEAAIRTAIGEAYRSLGEHRLAAKHLERALEIRRTHLGPDHPETLRSMRFLAASYKRIGRVSEAIRLYQRLLEDAKTRHGPDSPEMLQLTVAIAEAYRFAGDWQTAMRLLEQVVEKDVNLHSWACPALRGCR